MKTMTREEAIIAMLDGKQVTSDEFAYPDITYCIYTETQKSPFRYCNKNGIDEPITVMWNTKTWRLQKYIPEDKELCFGFDEDMINYASLVYYDKINNCIFNPITRKRDGQKYINYAPFDGTPPPNMSKPEDLED